ncbi:class I SAM-dependent methyltransferase [Chitinophaga rhizophila]|uniref:Class I SAM-dependent methyltransferase n=1 Tax=Chitinophaga rhizophila TaxID=2866212 RepID=A0ABS7GHR3_9BACT|nr:class I SAM-dependent methyltransferase [Chitinophaga rhizophila]MBW8687236.1 class I SAM-dependent methyltransferase [Chitinophaga rhizophila]
MKDNFSSQSDKYAQYRPTYPQELFGYLDAVIQHKHSAWDCGTGNGQIAYELAKTFDQVFATDISQSQIDNAAKSDNITYLVQPAESTSFPNKTFDLITIAQAIHWFNFEQFYQEVRRTAKDHAFICVIGYGRLQISEEIDAIITNFYTNVIEKYWDKERRYVDEDYQTIPFPFKEIKTPQFVNIQQWTLEHLIGYLNTWSAVKHFIKEQGINPVDDLKRLLQPFWQDAEAKAVRFPILLRLGQING